MLYAMTNEHDLDTPRSQWTNTFRPCLCALATKWMTSPRNHEMSSMRPSTMFNDRYLKSGKWRKWSSTTSAQQLTTRVMPFCCNVSKSHATLAPATNRLSKICEHSNSQSAISTRRLWPSVKSKSNVTPDTRELRRDDGDDVDDDDDADCARRALLSIGPGSSDDGASWSRNDVDVINGNAKPTPPPPPPLLLLLLPLLSDRLFFRFSPASPTSGSSFIFRVRFLFTATSSYVGLPHSGDPSC